MSSAFFHRNIREHSKLITFLREYSLHLVIILVFVEKIKLLINRLVQHK
jgi:hypothetical protein